MYTHVLQKKKKNGKYNNNNIIIFWTANEVFPVAVVLQ
jgi:hypothetical protein